MFEIVQLNDLSMNILYEQRGNKGIFYLEDAEDDEINAEMVFHLTPNHEMVIEHTEVNEDFRGQNIGYLLVEHAVEYARQMNMKIIPVCSFARSVLMRKREFSDVLG